MTISEQELLLRRMTPAQKLEVMRSVIRQAYELKAAAVRAQHPDLPDEEVEAEAPRLVARVGTTPSRRGDHATGQRGDDRPGDSRRLGRAPWTWAAPGRGRGI